ncbi:PDZ domain-containing protein [Candidatus Dependentiae bacterium]|nr:PDZ domain-containing protein [Candidatus Dependentiae bacterium]
MRRSIWPLILFSFILVIHVQQIANTVENNDFDKSIYKYSQTLGDALHNIKTKHFNVLQAPADKDAGSPVDKAMTQGINSIVRTLDPHSAFMDPKEYKSIMEATQGEFGGVGIIIDNTKETDDEFLRVIDTLPGEPADKAGIKPDDKIVQIGDEAVKGMTVEEASAKLRGKEGTSIHVKVMRADTMHLIPFNIVRARIKEQNALCYYLKDHNIYYLSLNMFTENAIKQIEQLLKKSLQHESKGMILDLRHNSGGLLNAVVDIAGLFLEKGSLVVETKDRNNKVSDRYTTSRTPIADKRIPLFILVNNYTASAAEILAGVLQYYSAKESKFLAFVVGTKTFGKGSVQEVIPLSNDCALKLTIALYNLPNNLSIQGVGVIPDFEIDPKMPPSEDIQWFNRFFGRESNLKNAIKVDAKKEKDAAKNKKDTGKTNNAEKSWYDRKKELIACDYMILTTARLIEMMHLVQKAYPEKTKKRQDLLNTLTALYNPKDVADIEEVKM